MKCDIFQDFSGRHELDHLHLALAEAARSRLGNVLPSSFSARLPSGDEFLRASRPWGVNPERWRTAAATPSHLGLVERGPNRTPRVAESRPPCLRRPPAAISGAKMSPWKMSYGDSEALKFSLGTFRDKRFALVRDFMQDSFLPGRDTYIQCRKRRSKRNCFSSSERSRLTIEVRAMT